MATRVGGVMLVLPVPAMKSNNLLSTSISRESFASSHSAYSIYTVLLVDVSLTSAVSIKLQLLIDNHHMHSIFL